MSEDTSCDAGERVEFSLDANTGPIGVNAAFLRWPLFDRRCLARAIETEARVSALAMGHVLGLTVAGHYRARRLDRHVYRHSFRYWRIDRAAAARSYHESYISLWRVRCCLSRQRKRPGLGSSFGPHYPFSLVYDVRLSSNSSLTPVSLSRFPCRVERYLSCRYQAKRSQSPVPPFST